MIENSRSKAYADAGVDITAGYRAVDLMKSHVKRTTTPGVVSGIGGFGGLFAPDLSGMTEPILVSGTDGVGTKLKLAFLLDRHNTVGIDCVAMCVNDVICCGAKPLFFLDYIACGKNVPERIADIVSGVADGCVQSGAALIGGMGLSDMHDKLMIKCARGEVKRISVRTAAGVEWNAAGSEDMLGLLESGIVADRIEMVALKSEDFSRFGFDRPSYTVSFELSDAASPLRRMLIGNSVKGGGRYAAIGGADAAFVLSAETVSAVVKPVSEHMEVSK